MPVNKTKSEEKGAFVSLEFVQATFGVLGRKLGRFAALRLS
jgi:hypothetical protein